MKIIKENIEFEINFNGIKIINNSNTTKTYKDLFLNSTIYINNINYKKEDIVYINELSKLSDFIDLGKRSFLVEKLVSMIDKESFIKIDELKNVVSKINNDLSYDLLETADGDFLKIILFFIEIIDDQFINEKTLNIILSECFDKSKLFILDNVSWLKIDSLYRFLNNHNFVILTADFRNIIKNKEMLEILCFWNNNKIIEILDYEKVISYLELKLSENIDNEKFYYFLNNKEDLLSAKIFYYLTNLN